MKNQTALEFLTTYSWTFLILGIFVVAILTVTLSPARETQTRLPESCYISPEIPCFQAVLFTNTSATKFIVILQNNLGVGMLFATNAIVVAPSYFKNTNYTGTCYPVNALSGSTVICNSTLQGLNPLIGSQLNPKFTINYKICNPTCSNQVYSTTGTAIVVVAPTKSVIFPIQLLTNPNTGKIAISGVQYANGANVIFILGLSYPTYAIPPSSAYMYSSWTPGSNGNVMISGAAQLVNSNAIGVGSLTATFILTTSTTSVTTTSTTSTTTTSTTSTSTSTTSVTSTSTTSTSTSSVSSTTVTSTTSTSTTICGGQLCPDASCCIAPQGICCACQVNPAMYGCKSSGGPCSC